MKRKYDIGKDNVLKSFMYSHYQACGWEYCVVICDAWKFRVTLRQAGLIDADRTMNDYLLIEVDSLEAGLEIEETLDVPCSIWDKGRMVLTQGNCKE